MGEVLTLKRDRLAWFFKLATVISEASKDPSTKVGCIIVGSGMEIRAQGYNGFAKGVDDTNPIWFERETKLMVTVHAEINAVANAARTGTSLVDCSAFITAPPCSSCTAVLINSGIKHVYCLDGTEQFKERWKRSLELSRDMFKMAKVQYYTVPDGFFQE